MATLSELASSGELMTNLTLRELRGKYKRSVLGWAWSLINPLATMAIFTVVFSYFLKVQPDVGHPSGLKNFAFFLLCALLPFNFLSNSMTGSMGALVGNANLIKKVYFPREILVAAQVVSWDVSLLIEFGVLSVALLVVGNFVIPWLPLVLVFVALLTVFVLGVSLMLSILNVYFRDVQHFVAILLQLWFYATPIVYPLRVVEGHQIAGIPLIDIYKLNPMVVFVEIFRDLMYDLRFPPLGDTLYVVVVSFVTFVIGLAVFWKLEPRLAEEL